MEYWATIRQLCGAATIAFAGWLLNLVSLPLSMPRNLKFILSAMVFALLGLWLIGTPINTVVRVTWWQLKWFGRLTQRQLPLSAEWVRYEPPVMFFIPRKE